ncbi:alpha-glucan family phosphorylase [Candidatus Palauibacter sp.]|uniref:alpha-glucan family phosphorylase n=1 Tax=Candidatus Palauibacter sp. TaxID=3101350 RepID=UPI003AF20DAF
MGPDGEAITVDDRRPPGLPDRIGRLWEFATDISWTWNREARAIFRSIDLPIWRQTRNNPVALLRGIGDERLQALTRNRAFLQRYDALCETLDDAAASESTWFGRRHPEFADSPVAYFCAEFALHESIPIYSGGLGVLAGDHLKAASDLGIPLVGVGLMYAHGYFDQTLGPDGWQEDADNPLDPGLTPLERLRAADGVPWLTWIYGSGRRIYIGAWRVRVGRVSLYLLDTDLDENDPADRGLSHQLYAGGVDHRLRQEALLGAGGVRVLSALGIEPKAWHANEGHAAFMMVERVRNLIRDGLSFPDAVARVRASTVFTTHTPVPAGHDVFSHEQMRDWTGEKFWEEIHQRDELLGLGLHPQDEGRDRFHMTAAAIRLARRVNGVSERHGHVSREIWRGLWGSRPAREVPIGHVTNGVHLETWMNEEIVGLLDACLPPDWQDRPHDKAVWRGVRELPAEALWRVRHRLKLRLLDLMREEARRRWREHWPEAAHLIGAGMLMSPYPLTIGFARRFAAYKRADLVFRDRDRLLALLSGPGRPVQLVFAGKAHPRDEEGKRVLQRVYEHTRDPGFEGRIAFIENYGLHTAHCLVEGVDLWLNLPRVPLEACGTSGMKAALNGVPQLATTDGWWEEGFEGDNGWTIPRAPDGSSEEEVDRHDHEHLFRLLEDEVVPLYYDRPDEGPWDGPPAGWLERARRAVEVAGARFTAGRMVREYVSDYYVPALRGSTDGDDPPTSTRSGE